MLKRLCFIDEEGGLGLFIEMFGGSVAVFGMCEASDYFTNPIT